jgi:uncharacterized coiled-coil DUF342 family protein
MDQDDIKDVKNDVYTIKQEHHEARRRCDDIQRALYTLVEAQKNTTKNVDRLADDVKILIQNSSEYHILENNIENLEKKCEELEASKQWGFRLLIGAFITAISSLLIDFFRHAS